MTDPTVVDLLDAAIADLEAAVEWYVEQGGADVAGRFLDAFEDVVEQIRRFPDAGSPQWATELGLSGLRSSVLDGFPYVAFHVHREHRVEVLRVLHERRDLPSHLTSDAQ